MQIRNPKLFKVIIITYVIIFSIIGIGILIFLSGCNAESYGYQNGMQQKINSLEIEVYYYKLRLEYYKSMEIEKGILRPYGWPIHPEDYKRITSPYGLRNNPLNINTGGQDIRNHGGIDLSGAWRGRVVAVESGIVIEHWPAPDWLYSGHDDFGGFIRILHDDGNISSYAHMSSTFIHEGDKVSRGQVIGRIGSTGKSSGQHLHFSLKDKSGNFVNPLLYIGLEVKE